jgi:hypothetical protein
LGSEAVDLKRSNVVVVVKMFLFFVSYCCYFFFFLGSEPVDLKRSIAGPWCECALKFNFYKVMFDDLAISILPFYVIKSRLSFIRLKMT